MAIIKVTKAENVRRYTTYYVEADALTPEQVALVDEGEGVFDPVSHAEIKTFEDMIDKQIKEDRSIDGPADDPAETYFIDTTTEPAVSDMKWPDEATHITATTIHEDGTKTVTRRPLSVISAAQELARVWAKAYPMEQEEIFCNLSCSEVQPIIDLLRSVGADEVAAAVEYAHARSDLEVDDDHHALYLKREADGEI